MRRGLGGSDTKYFFQAFFSEGEGGPALETCLKVVQNFLRNYLK